ncbi:MAG TPA: SDR family NAD(P)-dependent oxidoreductase [Chloroflexota bacterium]|nr:SDR family NAD(P)-dependent oxidoreductase [Chloroflexota bacterium]
MTSSLFDLTGRVALVTGGSRGIGRAIAVGLARAGARVAVASRTRETLNGVVEEIGRHGREADGAQGGQGALAVVADVTSAQDNRRMVEETVAHFGALDIFVAVAGVNRRKRILDVEPEDYEFVVGTNLRGLYLGCQAAVRVMVPRPGRPSGKIVTIGSLATLQGVSVGMSAYAASKGGVGQLTKQLAVELAPHNVQVNCIAPGFILTDLNRNFLGVEPRRSWVVSRTPAGRFGAPEDVAGTAVFLASPASDFVTGQVIAVDGGFLAGSDWG